MSESQFFKESVTDLNNGYRELLNFFSQSDTRVVYLKTFEAILSQLIPDQMLWQMDVYKAQTAAMPLPKNPRQRIDPEMFYSYMMLYEQIMRMVGLLDKEPDRTMVATTDVELMDMG